MNVVSMDMKLNGNEQVTSGICVKQMKVAESNDELWWVGHDAIRDRNAIGRAEDLYFCFLLLLLLN